MEFEWDENKRLSNLQKHGIDFVDIPHLFEGRILSIEDVRFAYGEQRFVTFGLLVGRVLAVVHTEQNNIIRIISARKATKNEEKYYFQSF